MIDAMKNTIAGLEGRLEETRLKLADVQAAGRGRKLSPEAAMDLSLKETALVSDLRAMTEQLVTWKSRLGAAVEAEKRELEAQLKRLQK